jgi:hypothetical protein
MHNKIPTGSVTLLISWVVVAAAMGGGGGDAELPVSAVPQATSSSTSAVSFNLFLPKKAEIRRAPTLAMKRPEKANIA